MVNHTANYRRGSARESGKASPRVHASATALLRLGGAGARVDPVSPRAVEIHQRVSQELWRAVSTPLFSKRQVASDRRVNF